MGLITKLLTDSIRFLSGLSIFASVFVIFGTFIGFWLIRYFSKDKGKNPFTLKCVRPRGELETDEKKRNAVLKQGFVANKVPADLDAIVIGSGLGGLTTAALLSKSGKKVLVLEQHDQAGGCCHTFIEKGFEFDVGIHYVGEVANNTLTHTLIDQIAEGQLGFKQVEKEIDHIVLGDHENPDIEVPLYSGKDEWKKQLEKQFPNDIEAVRKFFLEIRNARKNYRFVILLKTLPRWLSVFIIDSGLIGVFTDLPRLTSTSLKDYLDQLTDNKQLKSVLGYSFGDYGTQPRETPMLMQLMLLGHYLWGGFYPIGGASEIAFNIIPVIEKSGGKVLVRANVEKIIIDDNGAACGVIVKKGANEHQILAPKIISAAGVINTYVKLLPEHISKQHQFDKLLTKVRSGVGATSVFIGLDGTAEELGLKATNVWAFTNPELDEGLDNFIALPAAEVGNVDVPLLFISFPCTKDPSWNERFPGKSNCTIVTLSNWEWFSEWKDERIMKRGDEYDSIKTRLGERVWEQTCKLFPQLKDKRVFMDVGTPVTNNYYIASPKGEIYGLDHNVSRFNLRTGQDLRPETPIPGLYLTGQDILTCGFAGALYAGVLTAGAVLDRNVLKDLMNINMLAKKKAKFDKVKNLHFGSERGHGGNIR